MNWLKWPCAIKLTSRAGNSWNKFWQLSQGEQWIFIQSLLLLPLMALALRMVGFRRLQVALAHFSRPGKTRGNQQKKRAETPAKQAQRIARLVSMAASRGAYRANCFKQALTLWHLLHRRGIPCDLILGVRKLNNQNVTKGLEAHAWVEHLGRPLHQRDSAREQCTPFRRALLRTRKTDS